jgi:hypothetical protein
MARDFTGSGGGNLSIGDVAAIDITGTALSIHAWIQPDVNNVAQGIVSKWDGAGANTQYLLFMETTGKLKAFVTDGAATDTAVGATTVSTGGVWHPVGLRKNGTGALALAAFLDGVADGTLTSNVVIQNSTGNLEIGRTNANNANRFDGRIAEVGIWDVALSDAEFGALAKGASPLRFRRDHLKGYWPLFGVAYPEADLSGNVNNPTQVGTVNAANHSPVGRIAV